MASPAPMLVPPANRLEKLKGTLKDFYAIRINDQWRVIFSWINGEPHDVRIVDTTAGQIAGDGLAAGAKACI